jgi:hypothetical protein
LNLLLDTHVALWAITDNPKLSQKARDLIVSPKTTVYSTLAYDAHTRNQTFINILKGKTI